MDSHVRNKEDILFVENLSRLNIVKKKYFMHFQAASNASYVRITSDVFKFNSSN